MRQILALALLVVLPLAASSRMAVGPVVPGPAVRQASTPPPIVTAERHGTGRAQTRGRHHLPGPFPAEITDVVDGDTVEVRVTVWLGQEITTRLRLRGIDAPELASACPDEYRLAREARERLAELVAGEPIRVADVGLDKYGGRVVGRLLFASGEDVGQILAQEGYARLYDGGRRDSWCEPVLSARR